jgi:GNAT superfamily N-acetyltransferase
MVIRLYDGDRELLRPLFLEADDSETQVDRYLAEGDILVAEENGVPVGHVQVVDGDEAVELKSMAVVAQRRRSGVGAALVKAAVDHCLRGGAARMVVATAAADVGNLRFYQRLGFRMLRVERDAFTAASGYPDVIVIDGIPLRDQVWLDRELVTSGGSGQANSRT